MKKFLASTLFALLALTTARAQDAQPLPIPINAPVITDVGNGPMKLRVVAGPAYIFTSQGSGTGSTSGSSTSLTLTGTPATPPKVGAIISGTGITSGTTVAAYNGTTGITLSAAMTVPGGTALAWGASCPATTAGVTRYIQAQPATDFWQLYTQARVCVASPGGPQSALLPLPYGDDIDSDALIFAVPDNVSLMALPSTYAAQIVRLDFAPGNGAPPLIYVSSPDACTLNAGAGNNGSQVRSADGKCWLAKFSGTGVDVREFGAVANGATDAGPAINACISLGLDCVIPPSTLGFFINTTIQNTGSLRGTVAKINNPAPNTNFPGSSWLLCSANVTPCVQNGGATIPNLFRNVVLSNLIVSRVSGPPTDGTVGVMWNGGQLPHSENLYAFNHDTCFNWFASGVSGIGFSGYNLEAANCKTHYMVFDGWPEAYFVNGRLGSNGGGGYPAQDFVLFTNTACSLAGCGPNTIKFDNYTFLPNGTGNSPDCGIRWANFTNFPVVSEFAFSKVHFEWHDTTTGLFCSDATVPRIQQLVFSDSVTAVQSPIFALNSATQLNQVYIHDNSIGCTGGASLAMTPAASAPTFLDAHFSRNIMCGPNVFAASGTGNRLTLSENTFGATTISGAWSDLAWVNNVYSSLTDNATGPISWVGGVWRTVTPQLQFGGASTGITYATQFGQWTRTADGGWEAIYDILLTSKGSATGTAQIIGFPLACANAPQSRAGAGVVGFYNNMTSLSGGMFSINNPGFSAVRLFTNSASSTVNLNDTNFTNTSEISGSVRCGQAK